MLALMASQDHVICIAGVLVGIAAGAFLVLVVVVGVIVYVRWVRLGFT